MKRKLKSTIAAVLATAMVFAMMPVALASDVVGTKGKAKFYLDFLGVENTYVKGTTAAAPGDQAVALPANGLQVDDVIWLGVRANNLDKHPGFSEGVAKISFPLVYDADVLEPAKMDLSLSGRNDGSDAAWLASIKKYNISASFQHTPLLWGSDYNTDNPIIATTNVPSLGSDAERSVLAGSNKKLSVVSFLFDTQDASGLRFNGTNDALDKYLLRIPMKVKAVPATGKKVIELLLNSNFTLAYGTSAGNNSGYSGQWDAASAGETNKNTKNFVEFQGNPDLFPKVVATRKVTYALTNLSKTAGDATVKDEVTNFTATLKANAGYKLPAAVEVKMGNTTLTATNDYTYDSATGVIAISKAVDGDITITAVGTALGALTFTGGALTAQTYDTVLSGTPTVGTATSAENGETITGYALKADSTLPEGFSLNATTGAITGTSTKAYPTGTGKAFTITATTSLGRTIDANFTMVVAKKDLTPTAVTAGVPSVNKGATGAALTVVGSSNLAANQATATGYKERDAVVLKYNAVYANATNAADKVEVTLNTFTIEGTDAANYAIQQPAPALTAAIGKIVEKQVTGVAFTKAPTKTTFTHGDKLDLTGAVITVSWDKGSPTVHNVTAFNAATGATTLDVALPAGYVFKVGTKSGTAEELNLSTGLVLKATKNNGQAVSVTNGTITSTANPTLTVNKKNLTVTVVGTNKVYDGTTAGNGAVATIATGGVLAGEKVTVNATGGTFATTDAGTGIALNGVNLAFGTHATDDADAANYALTARTMNTTADITKADYKVEDFTAKTGAKNVMGTAFTIDQLIAAANSKNNEIASQVLKGTGFANVAITYTTTAAVPVAVADITKASAGTYNFTVTIPFADKDNFTNYTLKDGANAMTANKVITGIVTVANKPYIPPAPSDPTYTITYDEGVNGTITTNGTTSVVQGNKITKVPVVKAKPGFVFKGWSADGKTVIDLLSYEIKGNIKFTAVYKEAGKPVGFDKKTAEPYVKGYENNTFGPQNPIKRAEVATMLARILSEKMENGKTYNSIFADVAASAWYSSYVGFMEQFDIIKGTNGSFNPEASITRAEFVAMVMRVEGMAEGKTSSFPDVKDHWAENEIANAVEKGYIKGYADGSFAPDQTITRAEAVTILNRVLGRTAITDAASPFTDVPANHWAFGDIVAAAK